MSTSNPSTPNFLPLMIQMDNKEIVIFGGGNVGERKSKLFSQYAKTTVISSEFTNTIKRMGESGQINLVIMDLHSVTDTELNELISTAFIVITATSDVQLNQRIAELAKSSGILVNEVNGPGSDIVVPSIVQRGELCISISSSGSSPALSKFTRYQIERLITPEYADMIRVQHEIRTYLKQNVTEQEKRKDILWTILESKDVWDNLSISYENGYNKALDIAQNEVRTFTNKDPN